VSTAGVKRRIRERRGSWQRWTPPEAAGLAGDLHLARADGARKDILEYVTHARRGDITDQYSTLRWELLCTEVAKLNVELVGESGRRAGRGGGILD
jgi:hypothetical protein